MSKYHEPRTPINSYPAKISIIFDGKYICLAAIARLQHIDRSYLSRIFSCERMPSIKMAQKIAGCLGMDLVYFIQALERRKLDMEKAMRVNLDKHYDRAIREDTEDLKALKKGRIPIPRTPGTRLAS